MKGILDTNVALYLIGGRLSTPLPVGSYGISIITELELLSWPSMTAIEEARTVSFLRRLKIFQLTPEICNCVVTVRRRERLKLPDAIICATSLCMGVDLWTNDVQLAKVPGLTCRTVALVP